MWLYVRTLCNCLMMALFCVLSGWAYSTIVTHCKGSDYSLIAQVLPCKKSGLLIIIFSIIFNK